MVTTLFYTILIILIINFVIERWLDYLNTKNWTSQIPDELEGIYPAARYKEAEQYESANYRYRLVTESMGFIVMMMLLIFGGFGWLDGMVRSWVSHPILVTLIFFAVLGLVTEIVTLPFTWYDTFVIEERFGFNKSNPRLFLLDRLKGMFIGAIVGGIILYLISWIYQVAGAWFWIYALLVIAAFSVFMLLFYSSIIVPLFNKQKPLAEGELKNAILSFCNKAGFLLENVYVIDGSKRSTKANAYFTGMGRKKRIVLYDTLIAELNTEEVVAVLAHEIGHYKKHHVIGGLIMSLATTALMLFIFSLVSTNPAFAQVLGSDIQSFHLSIISFGILYSPLSLMIGLGMNYHTRLNEYQADQFAAQYHNPDFLASALKKLSVNNLSNLTPHPAYVFFHYSHPTLLQRLNKLARVK